LTKDDFVRPIREEEDSSPVLSGALLVKAHCLPFSQVPHTTRLFNDFLTYSPKVQEFYPNSPQFAEWMTRESAKISYDAARRERVAAILERQNRSWEASAKALANVERLRKGAAAIVTGQQVGLFGGPMFSIYKALTAVKLAEEATAAGVDAVPVFWLATYDHDLAEVNHVALPGANGALQTLTTSSHGVAAAPVGTVRLANEILPLVDQAAGMLGENEAAQLLRETYRPGETLGSAFARLYARIFGEYGVIILDASDAEFDRVAEPIFRAAVERADELATAVLARGKALEKAGYHQQVKVTPSSVLLFTMQDGARVPIHRRVVDGTAEFVFGSEGAVTKLTEAELLARIGECPEQFSPNVLLRPIVEDYLLPTLAYTGGAAETAYFAQAGAVYEKLLGRVTPIVPRFSATIVEPKTQRLLEKHGIAVTDVFEGPAELRQKIAARSLPADLQEAFDQAKRAFDSNLGAVIEKLAKLDRTLVDAAETSRSKIQHQMEKLYAQAARAEAQKGELVSRHAETLSQALYPEKGLQERGIGGIAFLARYGLDLLRQLHDAVHTDCHDHQILEL
jgi:bacillithiol biosynthesis cysteine-adding enzyme BshC